MSFWPVSVLTDPVARLRRYVPAAWFCATVPALIIVALLENIVPREMLDRANEVVFDPSVPFPVLAFGIVLFAPLFETLIMAALFWVMRKMGVPAGWQIAVQTVGWGIAHGAQAAVWAFAPAWLFFVFSVIYLTQRQRSERRAILVTTLVHALNNALPVIIYGLGLYTDLLPEGSGL